MNDNKLVNNPIEVAEIMNSFYIKDVATSGIPVFSDFSNIRTYTTACINYYENLDSMVNIKTNCKKFF